MRILIVEDDPLLGAGLQTGLRQDGYAADLVRDANAAEHAIGVEHFDLVVLDLGLPGRDGLDLLRGLRQDGDCIPVLILTARDTVADRVTDLDELAARIRALMRRRRNDPAPLLRAGDLTLDSSRRQAIIGRRSLCLSPKEYSLLEALVRSADRVVARARLQATAYDWHRDVESNAMEVHIHNLRRKLGKDRILTVRGIGYRLVSHGGE
jgi:two-component system response regulator QseB